MTETVGWTQTGNQPIREGCFCC